ncbi:RNA helicase [Perkinsela sp. CCAP 1560/4]|nr:RNA helicase [Perkinsela sp. CCAP 1560/4]|eukprot:KNH09493.1 RNA helicase [Perkinsela sp. CCAP 1560/4]
MPSLDSLVRGLNPQDYHARKDAYIPNARKPKKCIDCGLQQLLREATFPCDALLGKEVLCISAALLQHERNELNELTEASSALSKKTEDLQGERTFEAMLVEMYSMLDDDILMALTHLLYQQTSPKKMEKHAFAASCIDILGDSRIDLVDFVVRNPERLLYSLITDFLRLDIHQYHNTEKERFSRPTIYLSSSRKQGLSKEDKFTMNLIEKGRVLQNKEDAVTLFKTDMAAGGSSIPVGSLLRDFRTHIRLDLPVPEPLSPEKGELLAISSCLPAWSHSVFGHIAKLNTVQSAVFEKAFHSDENLLISAPTGCGKTLIAVLTILRSIQSCFDTLGTSTATESIKIVYLVPMKALAAQIVANFQQHFRTLGLKVKEFTGDMSLSKKEIGECNIVVATPEKWDVATRKVSESSLLDDFQLIIIDEVHLLNEDRGPVVEALVARILLRKNTSGWAPRIVGLSATLPNALDVANFLNVHPQSGLLVFGSSYRPVPLHQMYIGVKTKLSLAEKSATYNTIMCDCVVETLSQSKQVLVFVHARNKTVKIAKFIQEKLTQRGLTSLLQENSLDTEVQRKIRRLKSVELRDLVSNGIGIHHAGMLRLDRTLVEDLFKSKNIHVLVCTATLAWGVNLPAHAVIIHGTEIYDSKQGGYIHMSPLDVIQIFGRAGRPGFDSSGRGIIITNDDQVKYYVRMLSNSANIESRMLKELPNHLNAEISSMTVPSINDAMKWLEFTYLWHRLQVNPFAYGVTVQHLRSDRNLYHFRSEIIRTASSNLQSCGMIRYDESSCKLHSTELGRIASHYYISYESIASFNEITLGPNGDFRQITDEEELLRLIASCQEFREMRVRPEEEDEIAELMKKLPFALRCRKTMDSCTGPQVKVIMLLKFYFSRLVPQVHSLVSDTFYIIQNVERICRALFEIEVYRQHSESSLRLLVLAKCISKHCWADMDHPLLQFEPDISPHILSRIETRMPSMTELAQLSGGEMGEVVQNKPQGFLIKRLLSHFPKVSLHVNVQPMTRNVIRVMAIISPEYVWSDKYHGTSDYWWLSLRDCDKNTLLHNEYFSFTKKKLRHSENIEISFIVPVHDAESSYELVVENSTWVGSTERSVLYLNDCTAHLEANYTTRMLPLSPLGINVIPHRFHPLYPYRVFNSVQTHCFHALYHTDNNVFLGAPTGSGKTVCAEFGMLRILQQPFRTQFLGRIVYIAPLKALVRERVHDWKARYERILGITVLELTGDRTPFASDLEKSQIICTTPEKWDGISRNWQHRKFVRDVALLVIDEVHLLGSDRGPILEMICSRAKIIGWKTKRKMRIVALSTSVANVHDMTRWLGVEKKWATFNFEPSVRPVPMKCFISGFPGRAYCPRMATMNKPVYEAIIERSPSKPVIVFVSSRRQTRLTALAIITMLLQDGQPNRFSCMEELECEKIIQRVEDTDLRYVLTFGIGIHHGGLCESDRHLVEKLFKARDILILVATSTLAWGVNFPAHMVVVKGTEFFSAPQRAYVDIAITDILQMIGRAGRPQYDTEGIAVVLTQDNKKEFYKKFLYNAFPVESYLPHAFIPHMNAEIANGTIQTCGDMVDYFTWTFLFQRILKNPLYYGIQDATDHSISAYLSDLVFTAISELRYCFCIEPEISADGKLETTEFGRLCASYYLSHHTIRRFVLDLKDSSSTENLLKFLAMAEEFAELPVRHNEDLLNLELAKNAPIAVDESTIDSPHTKAHLLFQAHFERSPLPICDYITDTRSVIENSARIVQCMIDVAAVQGFLTTALNITLIWKSISQRRWWYDCTLLQITHCQKDMLGDFAKRGVYHIRDVLNNPRAKQIVTGVIGHQRFGLSEAEVGKAIESIENTPQLSMSISLKGNGEFKALCSVYRRKTHKKTTKSSYRHTEQFCAIIGDSRTNQLIALKHIHHIEERIDFALKFDWDDSWEQYSFKDAEGGLVYALQLHLICGSWFGVDIVQDVKVCYRKR